MADGMKSGSADDPFADDSDVVDGDESDPTPDKTRTEPTTTDQSREEQRSYLERRDGAKDGRKLVQFFLRDEVYSQRDEQNFRLTLADELDVDDLPGKFDTREALVKVAQEHPGEVADALEEMGYGR